jgi:hypothetical protein
MELLIVALGGALIGLAARYSIPGRATQGAVLIPALATGLAAVIWVALTWLGMKWDGGWIWWLTFAVTAAITVGVDLLLTRRREHGDNALLHALMKSGALRTS